MFIRKEQMEVFREASLRAFEDRTYAHLLEYFPRHCALLGETQMREAIRFGWRKAEGYELSVEPCVRSYIDFMCLLGGRFDTDPLLPWAAEILNDRSSSNQIERGDRLYDRAWEYIRSIIPDYSDASGQPKTARFVTELRRLRALPDDILTLDAVSDFSRALLQWFKDVWPAKCHYVGKEAVDRSITTAIDTASAYGISGKRSVTLVAVFMFVLGRGFDSDPLIPWASATLNDGELTGTRKGDRLRADGVRFLRRWWNSTPSQGD